MLKKNKNLEVNYFLRSKSGVMGNRQSILFGLINIVKKGWNLTKKLKGIEMVWDLTK